MRQAVHQQFLDSVLSILVEHDQLPGCSPGPAAESDLVIRTIKRLACAEAALPG
jgi:hypothetical protein